MHRARVHIAVLLVALFLVSTGCDNTDEIVVHRLPKNSVANSEESSDRMLVGLTFHEGDGWYFKLVGAEPQVDEQVDAFLDFLRSVNFENGTAQWNAPQDWNEKPGSGAMRKATFFLPEGDLEVAVTSFPFGGDLDEGLLLNVNRWRKEMGLDPVGADEVAGSLKQLPDTREKILVMDVVGKFTGGMSAGNAPFMNAMGGDSFSNPVGGITRPPTAPPSGQPDIDFDLPDSWQESPPAMFALYGFEIDDQDGSATLSVSAMTRANKWEPNVERWKGMLGQSEISAEETAKLINTIKVDQAEGKTILIESPSDSSERQAMYAAMVDDGSHAWFFKLSGDHQTVMKERENFESFLKSVKFK